MQFKFCPTCGKLLTLKEAGDDGPTPYCGSCDKMWFDMFASCIIVLVANEYDEIALLHQPNLSERGVFVSGYITPGESAEEAAVREVKEELGLEIEELESTGTYWFQKQEQLMHGFIGRVKKKELVCSSEIESALWVQAENAPDIMFLDWPGNNAWDIYREFMKKIRLVICQASGKQLQHIIFCIILHI